jgi:glutathione S-transferase
MVTVYSNQGSGNCYKVRLVLTQVGIPFRTVEMDVLQAEQKQPAYLEKNPNGKVPLVELDDGTCIAESGAILYHFAQGTALWPQDRLEQTRALQWMFFEQYSHEPNIAVARFWCHYLNAAEAYREALVEKHQKGYEALDVMEQQLERNDFFSGGGYSVADIALYAYTHVAHEGSFSLDGHPAVRAWLARVAGQPAHIPITQVC